MTPNLLLAQAVFDGSNLRVRSENFLDTWIAPAQRLIAGFGVPPPEMGFDGALFAQPMGSRHVAVVQAAGALPANELHFRFLILDAKLYSFLHDPFAIAERYPPDWEATRSLPVLEWPHAVLPQRTMAALDTILKNGDGPFLLGAAQTLVDGAKILLRRAAPAPTIVKDLWSLLPASVRQNVWPTTYAFSSDLGFDVLVMPTAPETGIPGYLSEDQARDYPESRYERNLQAAVESGDSSTLEHLLARKSTSEMIRFALWLLVGMMAFALVARIIFK